MSIAWGQQYIEEAATQLFVAEENFKTVSASLESLLGVKNNSPSAKNFWSPVASAKRKLEDATWKLESAREIKEKIEEELATIGPDAVFLKPEIQALIPRLMEMYGLSHDFIEQLIFSLSVIKPQSSLLAEAIENNIFDHLPTIDPSQSKTALGSGAVGAVFQNAVDPNVAYKAMIVTTSQLTRSLSSGDRRPGLRDYLVETFIQAVLTIDPETAPHISNLHNVFRYGPPGGENTGIVIKMEKLMPLFSEEVTDKDIIELYMQADAALKIINAKYKFKHGDFHIGNIMRGNNGALKIIDFGFSSIELAGVNFKSTFYGYHGENNIKHLVGVSSWRIKDEDLKKRVVTRVQAMGRRRRRTRKI